VSQLYIIHGVLVQPGANGTAEPFANSLAAVHVLTPPTGVVSYRSARWQIWPETAENSFVGLLELGGRLRRGSSSRKLGCTRQKGRRAGERMLWNLGGNTENSLVQGSIFKKISGSRTDP
jgi:hypothetical protein